MNKDLELMESILIWLLRNKNLFNRVNHCIDEYRNYIYDDNGSYLIGGEEVVNFIEKADKLLFSNKEV